jgi:tripartite-type tricarboxylate transporter receptor subunit TctC
MPKVRGHRQLPFRATMAVAVSGLVALFASACSSSASSGTSGSGTSSTSASGQPDYAFFKGQTIHFTVTNAPGTSSAAEINSIEPYLSKYLDAKIDITYDTSPINVGNDVVAGQPATGLFLGVTDLTAAVIDPIYGQPETFKSNELSYIGGTADGIHAIVACAKAPFQTAEQLISGQNQVKAPLVYPGESYLASMMFLRAYNVPTTILPGYTGQTAFPACETGQGNFLTSLILQVTDSAGTATVPGIKPLLLSGKLGPDNPQNYLNSQVETIADFAKAHPPTTAQGKQAIDLAVSILSSSYPNEVLFGPKGIPADRLLALTDAMQKAEQQTGAITVLSHNAIPPGFFGPSAIVAKVNQIESSQKLILALAGPPPSS